MVDLTELILANRGPLADPLIKAAGTDVSHWFSLQPPASDGKKRKTRGSGGGAKSGPTTATANEDGSGGGDRRQDECEVAGDPRTFVDPQTGLTVPYLPMGRLVQNAVHIAHKLKLPYFDLEAGSVGRCSFIHFLQAGTT